MDKQEYREIVTAIRKAYDQKKFEEVLMISDELDPKKISDSRVLEMIAGAHEELGELPEATEVLLRAYEKTPMGRKIAYKLSDLSIRQGDLDGAVEFYEDFCKMAPNDNDRFLLKYRIGKAGKVPKKDLAKVLSVYCSKEVDEKWMAELAGIYDELNESDKCNEVCDEIILWFADGQYVKKALELKQKNGELTPSQKSKLEQLQGNSFAPETVRVPEPVMQEEPERILRPERFETEQHLSDKEMDAILEEFITIEDATAPADQVLLQKETHFLNEIPYMEPLDEPVDIPSEDPVADDTVLITKQAFDEMQQSAEPETTATVEDLDLEELVESVIWEDLEPSAEAVPEPVVKEAAAFAEAAPAEEEPAAEEEEPEPVKENPAEKILVPAGKPFSNIEVMQVARSAPPKDDSEFWKMPDTLNMDEESGEELREPVYGSHRWFEEKPSQTEDPDEPIFGSHRFIPAPEINEQDEAEMANVEIEEVEPEPLVVEAADGDALIPQTFASLQTSSSGAELLSAYAATKGAEQAVSEQAAFVRKPELGKRKVMPAEMFVEPQAEETAAEEAAPAAEAVEEVLPAEEVVEEVTPAEEIPAEEPMAFEDIIDESDDLFFAFSREPEPAAEKEESVEAEPVIKDVIAPESEETEPELKEIPQEAEEEVLAEPEPEETVSEWFKKETPTYAAQTQDILAAETASESVAEEPEEESAKPFLFSVMPNAPIEVAPPVIAAAATAATTAAAAEVVQPEAEPEIELPEITLPEDLFTEPENTMPEELLTEPEAEPSVFAIDGRSDEKPVMKQDTAFIRPIAEEEILKAEVEATPDEVFMPAFDEDVLNELIDEKAERAETFYPVQEMEISRPVDLEPAQQDFVDDSDYVFEEEHPVGGLQAEEAPLEEITSPLPNLKEELQPEEPAADGFEAALLAFEAAQAEQVQEEPAYEEPAYEEPAYEEPVYEEPAYEEPVYEEPAYEEPQPVEPADGGFEAALLAFEAAQAGQVQGEPAYEEPVYEEPVYEEPVYEEPVYEEPAYEEPQQEAAADGFAAALLAFEATQNAPVKEEFDPSELDESMEAFAEEGVEPWAEPEFGMPDFAESEFAKPQYLGNDFEEEITPQYKTEFADAEIPEDTASQSSYTEAFDEMPAAGAVLEEDLSLDEFEEEAPEESAPEPVMLVNDSPKTIMPDSNYEIPEELAAEFSEFFLIEGMEEKICSGISNLVARKRAGDPTGGNLIVTGDAKSGKTYLTISVLKAVGRELGTAAGRVAKVKAEALNGKDLNKVLAKIAGSDLIIENAGYLKDATIEKLIAIMQGEGSQTMIVLEGNRLGLENIVTKHPQLKVLFGTWIDLEELSLSGWADLAVEYAAERGYKVGDMALLALHAKIDEMNLPTTHLGMAEIESIIDNAIENAQKRTSGKFFRGSKKNKGEAFEFDETDFM